MMRNTARNQEPADIKRIEKEALRMGKAYQIALENKVTNQQIRKAKKSLKLLVKNPKWVIAAVKKEAKAKKKLLTVTPGEWRQRILQLPEPLQTKIGCLVWWDYFGSRDVTKRWPELDDIVGRHASLEDKPDFSREELITGLWTVGYTSYLAWKRINESLDDE